MTEDDEEKSIRAIETCRRVNRSAGMQYLGRGVSSNDIAIAALYSAHDLAMNAGRDPRAAIEWMRTALDIMERKLLADAAERDKRTG